MLKGIHEQKILRTFIKNREMGHADVPQTNGAAREENIVQNMCSFENQIDSEGAVSRLARLSSEARVR